MGKKDGKRQSTMEAYTMAGNRGPDSQQQMVEATSEVAEPVIQQMFTELQKGISQINAKLDDQGTALAGLQTAVDTLKKRTQQTETKIDATETKLSDMAERLKKAESKVMELQERQEDQEGRSRRNNVRVVGLDEKHTARPFEPFMEALLKELVGAEGLSSMFVVERAHRSLTSRPIPGAPPRPVIVRILNYRDRDAVLRLAREKGELSYKGSKISIYPDFTFAVQTARRAFLDVKDTLRHHKIPYSMLYPARLRVEWNDKNWLFSDPVAAEAFIVDNIGELMRRLPRPSGANTSRKRGTRGGGKNRNNNARRLDMQETLLDNAEGGNEVE